MIKGIKREQNWNSNITVGVGYIAVPFGVDRDNFVETCYRKERVNIILDQGGTMVKDCYIDSRVLQSVKFPKKYDRLGSQVIFVMDKFNTIPVVIASVTRSKERVVGSEESIVIEKSKDKGKMSLIGDGKGKLLINLRSQDGSSVKLSVRGASSDITLNSDGIITLNAEDDITLNSSKEIVYNFLNTEGEVSKSLILNAEGLIYRDDNGNHFKIDYNNNKIIHNNGNQPIPKGEDLRVELNKLKNKLDTFLDTFSNTVVIPSDGGEALQTAVKLATSLVDDPDFDNINSAKSFID